jgi:hypothetical protein
MKARKQDSAPIRRLATPLRAVAKALAELRVPGMLIGGLASIAHGVPRATRDVDATFAGGRLSLEAILAGFARHRIVPRIPNAADFATQNQVLLLRHRPSGVDVDVSIAWLPFELEAIRSARTMTVAGARVPVVRPEDLIVYKALAWRPQDQQDIERLLARHGKKVDLARVRKILAEFAEALEEPERVEDLDRLLRRLRIRK